VQVPDTCCFSTEKENQAPLGLLQFQIGTFSLRKKSFGLTHGCHTLITHPQKCVGVCGNVVSFVLWSPVLSRNYLTEIFRFNGATLPQTGGHPN
jgi:hypothetical protein